MDFKEIREKGLLLFEYIRGSHLYNLNTETSDEDHGGVYIEPIESILGYIKCPEMVKDEKQDDSWYSLEKYFELISKSNPTVLESLYIPEDKILYKHPLFDLIIKHRNEFLSKKCFHSFIGYAKEQLIKARNLTKKIVCPPGDKKKSVVEFYFYGTDDGKTKLVKDWLEEREMDQKFVGLSNMDKMPHVYSAFYDWGAHLKQIGIDSFDKFLEVSEKALETQKGFIWTMLHHCWIDGLIGYDIDDSLYIEEDKLKQMWDIYKTPFHYRGITNEKDTTNQLRFSSIPKGEKRILEVSYNQDEYQRYCKVFKEWNDFKKHHNPERFDLAKEKGFDRKNACHSARLFEMGIEIANGEGVILDRSGRDREFLLSIRKGKIEYDDLIKHLKNREEIMKNAMKNSTLPDEIDINFLHSLSIDIRKQFYGIN